MLQGQPLHPPKHALQVFTDASKEVWGAYLNEHTARGTWSIPESKPQINYCYGHGANTVTITSCF